jgi:Bardet-Biedl syndrome 2 protein
MMRHPKQPVSETRIPIQPLKYVPAELLIKVIVGNKSSLSYHVFEIVQKLPKFASFLRYQGKVEEPDSYVTFAVSERVNRVIMWLNQSFILEKPLDNQLEETLYFPKEKKVLKIFMKSDGRVTK